MICRTVKNAVSSTVSQFLFGESDKSFSPEDEHNGSGKLIIFGRQNVSKLNICAEHIV